METGGAIKNVLAIGAGISDGLGFGANTRIALITRGLVEMTRLGVALGAQQGHVHGARAARRSRAHVHRTISRAIAAWAWRLRPGQSAAAAQKAIGQVVEGVQSATAVRDVAARLSVARCRSARRCIACVHERRVAEGCGEGTDAAGH